MRNLAQEEIQRHGGRHCDRAGLPRRSQADVKWKDRDGWLSLLAPDAVVQDPIGPSPFDPAGDGHRGPEAMRAFWELDKAKLVEA